MSGHSKIAVSLLIIDDNPGSLHLLSNALYGAPIGDHRVCRGHRSTGAPRSAVGGCGHAASAFRSLAAGCMAQPGLEILTASDPKEGLELFHKRLPHIVLTDLVMPHMTGMEVVERIMEADPATDVILMTAHYSVESAVEAIKKGASDYLTKPVSIARSANAPASWWRKPASGSVPYSLKTSC